MNARTLAGMPAVRYLVDWAIPAITIALYSVAWPTLHLTHVVPAALAPFIAALAAFPFLLIRVNPGLGWAISALSALVVSVGFAHQPGSDLPWQVVHSVCLIMLLFVVAVREPIPVVCVAWAATSLLFASRMPGAHISLTPVSMSNLAGAGLGWPIALTALVVFALLIRWLVLSREALAHQEEVTELERARRTILEERARVARDLHDVVAHHMSMVVVQAQSAPYRVPNVYPEAAAEFEAISVSARTALNEIRSVLGLLRSDGQLPEDVPQPGLAQLDELVRAAQRAGMAVTCELPDDLEPVAETIGLALYRILQESLANAARHAPGAEVRVRIDGDADTVVLTVSSGPGTDRPGHAGEGGGRGLVGMRERAHAAGGQFEAQARPDGGFDVIARLPRSVETSANVHRR